MHAPFEGFLVQCSIHKVELVILFPRILLEKIKLQLMSWICIVQNDEAAVLQGEKEAEKMIVEAYSALLLAFLSTERFLFATFS